MLKYTQMEDEYLYQQIAEAVRRQILQGDLKPGDRLPPLREMARQWGCTLGTVQRAYGELSRQNLVTSRSGQGTHVLETPPVQSGETPLRRAALVHRAEAFLLEVLTAGHSPQEVEQALRMALDRWRTIEQEKPASTGRELRFAGSHDLVIAWLATHMVEIAPGHALQLSFSGSLGGLIALSQGQADLAGCHLWDEDTDTYNIPFVRRLLPGRRFGLLRLADRRLGWILPPGNPHCIQSFHDIAQPGLRMINRQPGSGTRVWLDVSLRQQGIEGQAIAGYADECMTHSAVAQAVAEGRADIALGLEAAARAYGLDFVMLTRESYDLVIPEKMMAHPAVHSLVSWLRQENAKEAIGGFAGYETQTTGTLVWI
ncbi:MAG: GntR family transcriptional regulator [Anaerolineales bacterium]|nr:GntR family transcriptional regulator [Anaerolineales bacterium]